MPLVVRGEGPMLGHTHKKGMSTKIKKSVQQHGMGTQKQVMSKKTKKKTRK